MLLAWSIPAFLGVPFAIATRSAGGTPIDLWRVVLTGVLTWEVWTPMSLAVSALTDRLPVQRPWRAKVLLTHVLAAVTTCALQAAAAASAVKGLSMAPGVSFIAVFSYWLFLLAPAGVVVYAAVVAFRMSQLFRAREAVREEQARALSEQLAESQLHALRAQLRPHFLFNTLNAIIALVRDGHGARAVSGLTTLSSLLRASLRGDGRHEVPLDEELALTQQYLAIEQLRFGDRLAVRVDVPDDIRTVRVPSLILQPFVENALRHGLRDSRDTWLIEIAARARDTALEIEVSDNGSGLPAGFVDGATAGVGVANTRARLRELHGERASVSLRPHARGRGVTAALTIPLSAAS